MTDTSRVIEFRSDSLEIDLAVDEVGVVHLRRISPSGSVLSRPNPEFFPTCSLPLTSIRLVGEGHTSDKTAKCLVGSYASLRFKYQNHEIQRHPDCDVLKVNSFDDSSTLRVGVPFTVFKTVPVLRTYATVTNTSPHDSVVVTQLSSLTLGGLTTTTSDAPWYDAYTLSTATNGWFREAQWRTHTLPSLGIDDNGICQLNQGHSGSQANFSLSNRGSFSTGSYLPMGLLQDDKGTDTWIWQIEHNGSWRWEIGDYKGSIYLSAGGPTSVDHSWQIRLGPNESFDSVPVALCHVHSNFETAFGAMTDYRRIIRRAHPDNDDLPIIFNDYMNCLMGDPDEDKIKALLPAVAQTGAEYFVIDAGWYADDSNWWDDVGLWEPSKRRFPSGFKALLDTIKAAKLKPGLWLEPEVVGVRSVVAQTLPDDAFFQEEGQRVVERGRYQLDYRHPAVKTWMHSVVRNLVVHYGAEYFKFDYNIEVLNGSSVTADSSPGAAHLDHQRAYLGWVREVLDR